MRTVHASTASRAFARKVLPTLIALICGTLLAEGSSPAHAAQGGGVHGTIYTEVRDVKVTGNSAGPLQILLPDISVYLVDQTTSAHSVTMTTDVDGAFSIPPQPEAVYKLCWEAVGFVAGCSAQTFVLRAFTADLKPVAIAPVGGAMHGRVTFKDGQPCRFVAPIFGVNTIAEVKATPTSGAPHVVQANSGGYYVIGGLPSGAVNVEAACEGAVVSDHASASELPNDLVLPNLTPSIASYTVAGNSVVRSADPNTTVSVRTEILADGGYPLHYRWAVDPPQANFSSQDAASVDWQVPGGQFATIYVLASDGKGGYALNKVALTTTPGRILFSGHVRADNAANVAGATVTIDDAKTTTDTNGNFALVLPQEAPRYVVTIDKLGYKLFSRALHAPVIGASFKLFSAEEFQMVPAAAFTVSEKRNEVLLRTTGDNTNGQGVEVDFDANAIADGADGRGPLHAAPIYVHVGTYAAHASDDQLPGDYAGLDKNGNAMRLSSLGASQIGIHDLAGNPLNLAPGKSALVRQPIDAALLAEAPATVPFWSYDESRGVWVEEGVATKVGAFYEAHVTHFSAVNMDLAFNNGACTRILVDTHIMPQFQLRMTPKSGPGVRPDHQNQWVNDAINVVVREPPNTQIQFDVVDGDGNILPLASQTITTGASSPTGLQWPPPPPAPGDQNAYSDCTSTLTYDFPHVQALFPKPSPDFTTFLTYLTPPAYLPATPAQTVAANQLTTSYYQKIDPSGSKTKPGDANDFVNWKTANGFDANDDNADDAHTSYFNLYDLAFGRDMHMKRGGVNNSCTGCVAFYVTNYHAADDAAAKANPIATVAMEYSPQSPGGANYTKFYVFGANGAISNTAALDDNGAKFVPALCVICHNGTISTSAPTGDALGNLGNSRFIPFDLDSFGWPSGPNQNQSNAQVQAAFKAMNQGVLQTNVSASVQALIRNWYGSETDPTLPNPTFDGSKVPSGWLQPTDESALYNAFVKPYCRSCHTTRDPNDASSFGQDITWQSYNSLDQSAARFFACGPGKKMPQAERNYGRFWFGLNPHGPAAFAASPVASGPAACN